MTKLTITYKLSEHDDGYRVRDWFKGGESTLHFAETATNATDAAQILRAAYLGPDSDGVTVDWDIEEDDELDESELRAAANYPGPYVSSLR